MCVLFALLIETLKDQLLSGAWWSWTLLTLVGITMVGHLVLISRQPVAPRINTFATPFTPWLPGISIIINMYLMMMLDYMTWVRFAVWIAVGLAIYLSYGLWKSKERFNIQQRDFMNNKQNEGSIFACSKEILVATGQ